MSDQLADCISDLVQSLPSPLLKGVIDCLNLPTSPKALLAQQRLLNDANLEHQALLKRLFEAMKAAEVSPQTLALALKASARVADHYAHAQQIELVWTGPSSGVPTRQTGQVVQEVIRAAQKQLWIVSFTVRDIDELKSPFSEALSMGVSLKFIMEDKSEKDGTSMKTKTLDALSEIGLANHPQLTCYIWPPFMRQQKINRASQPYLTDSLHAKCLLADTHKLFITSANLTRTALNQNMELGVVLTGGGHPQLLAQHFQNLIEKNILLALPKDSPP